MGKIHFTPTRPFLDASCLRRKTRSHYRPMVRLANSNPPKKNNFKPTFDRQPKEKGVSIFERKMTFPLHKLLVVFVFRKWKKFSKYEEARCCLGYRNLWCKKRPILWQHTSPLPSCHACLFLCNSAFRLKLKIQIQYSDHIFLHIPFPCLSSIETTWKLNTFGWKGEFIYVPGGVEKATTLFSLSQSLLFIFQSCLSTTQPKWISRKQSSLVDERAIITKNLIEYGINTAVIKCE